MSAKVRAALLLGMMLAPVACRAQTWESAVRVNTMLVENDAFFGDSDSGYTQGLRLMTERGYYPERFRPLLHLSRFLSVAWLVPRAGDAIVDVDKSCRGFNSDDMGIGNSGCGFSAVGITQTIHTPASLQVDTLLVADRPYVGVLAGNLSHLLVMENSSYRGQIDIGIAGPLAIARETQTVAHWTWSSSSRRPRGWDNQLKTMLHVQLSTQFTRRVLGSCDEDCGDGLDFDLSLRSETQLGTVMGRLSGGGVLRVGYGMPPLVGGDKITVSAPRTGGNASAGVLTWGLLFATFDARAVGWNHLLQGTPGVDRAWRRDTQIALRPGLTEYGFGGALGGRWGGISAQRVVRSAEYRPYGGKHPFGSITVFITRPMWVPE